MKWDGTARANGPRSVFQGGRTLTVRVTSGRAFLNGFLCGVAAALLILSAALVALS